MKKTALLLSLALSLPCALRAEESSEKRTSPLEWSLGLQELDLSGMTHGFGAMKAKALGIAFLRTGKARAVFAFEP
jgi:hypothetical protein